MDIYENEALKEQLHEIAKNVRSLKIRMNTSRLMKDLISGEKEALIHLNFLLDQLDPIEKLLELSLYKIAEIYALNGEDLETDSIKKLLLSKGGSVG